MPLLDEELELLDVLEVLALDELEVDALELEELLELESGSVAMPVQEKPLSLSLHSRVMM
jgi:hypothetical protein